MKEQKISIIGAGLSGLIAASHFQNAEIHEAKNNDSISKHKALLRFRTPDIGDHLGIPFREVKVRKGIWYNHAFHDPNIYLCNHYSQKVSDIITDRSIWNIQDETRYIAPDNLHEILLDRYSDRIKFGSNVQALLINQICSKYNSVISTVPLGYIANVYEMLDEKAKEQIGRKFQSKSIFVQRWKVEGCRSYQTVYYPDRYMSLYRASLTGEMLIVEYLVDEDVLVNEDSIKWQFNEVKESFGIVSDIEFIEEKYQSNGKISPIDDSIRKSMIQKLTMNYNVFSLGRFAIWKNILLDDVYKDIKVIKKLISMDQYDIVKRNLCPK